MRELGFRPGFLGSQMEPLQNLMSRMEETPPDKQVHPSNVEGSMPLSNLPWGMKQ